MANISDVYGTVTFRVKEEKDTKALKDFIKIFQEAYEEFYYYITIDPEEIKDLEARYSFTAIGRWAFVCNLENLVPNLYHHFKDEKQEDKLEELRNICKHNIEIEFEYCEYEPGCGIFQDGEVKVKTKINENIPTSVIMQETFSPIEHTTENLVQCGFYDIAYSFQTEKDFLDILEVVNDTNIESMESIKEFATIVKENIEILKHNYKEIYKELNKDNIFLDYLIDSDFEYVITTNIEEDDNFINRFKDIIKKYKGTNND